MDEDILELDESIDLGRVNPEAVKDQHELVRQAELVADQGEQGQVHLLYHEKLDPVPKDIKCKFSAVLGDGFHLLSWVKVPVNHELKKAYKIAMMKALYAMMKPSSRM